ncbi:MAG: acylneuraminate cytidylyltransferase family protein [archaeon]
MKKGNIFGVITARGGSKGVPRKNVRDLSGKPLIAYTIEEALKSNLLDRVVVSTDDAEIAEISRKYGAEVPFMRPAELATDTAHHPEVIEHAVSWLESHDNYPVYAVMTLQPTSPLRTAEHIDKGIEKFLSSDFDSLVSLKFAFPPYWVKKLEGDYAVPFIEYKRGINPHNLERQQLPLVYQIDGAIFITKRDYLKKTNSLISLDNCSYILLDDANASLDIDSEEDFKMIEEIISKKKTK